MTLEQERADLLRNIINDPDDDMPRLIYADWLEERGTDERDRGLAIFIRDQIALHHENKGPGKEGYFLSYETIRYMQNSKEERVNNCAKFICDHPPEAEAFFFDRYNWRWRRGFLDEVHVSYGVFLSTLQAEDPNEKLYNPFLYNPVTQLHIRDRSSRYYHFREFESRSPRPYWWAARGTNRANAYEGNYIDPSTYDLLKVPPITPKHLAEEHQLYVLERHAILDLEQACLNQFRARHGFKPYYTTAFTDMLTYYSQPKNFVQPRIIMK